MVQAILDGHKTQTRRIVWPQPILHYRPELYRVEVDSFGRAQWRYDDPSQKNSLAMVCGPDAPSTIKCKKGAVGDRLWVKETFYYDICPYAHGRSLKVKPADFMPEHFYYRADGTEFDQIPECEGRSRWRPSIFMSQWMSRITLEITAIRIERLHAISDDDCIAEGCMGDEVDGADQPLPIMCYKAIWERINGPNSWAENPFVWVISFKKI